VTEQARLVVSSDPAPSESIAGESKNTAGRPKRCEHKRKRSEKGERRVELEPSNTRRVKLSPTTKQGSKRVGANTAATTIASTAKTSSKKRTEQKKKKSGAATGQRVYGNLNGSQGQGEGAKKQSSQYRGVSWQKSENKWKAQIRYDGKKHYLGLFKDEEEAAREYDRPARTKLGEKAQLNFPTKKEQAAEEAKQQRWIKCEEAGSKYRGVSWRKTENKWIAQIRYDGKKHGLGCFEDEEEAARAYDRAARTKLGEKAQLNFPTKKEQAAEEAKQQRWIKCGEAGEAGSKYRGVSWEKRNTWKAAIEYDGKHHHLGYFENKEEAARTYDRAARAKHGEKAQLNFPAGESGPRKSPKHRGI
jgi:uncharacterized membrane-anchored protein